MSGSQPPRSIIPERVRQSHHAEGSPSAHHRTSFRRKLRIRLAAVMLWLHIYVSMFGLAAVLFFSVTGITLNHPNWFFGEAESSNQARGRLNPQWVRLEASAVTPGAEPDPSRSVAKLEIVEYLRQTHGLRGALADFRIDDEECAVTFKGPGYAADVFIDRQTGEYDLTETYHGFIAVVNDLHKGRDTGPVWSVVIDVSAVLLTIVSLTGLVLLFFLKLRRVPGMAIALIGTILVVSIVLLGVP